MDIDINTTSGAEFALRGLQPLLNLKSPAYICKQAEVDILVKRLLAVANLSLHGDETNGDMSNAISVKSVIVVNTVKGAGLCSLFPGLSSSAQLQINFRFGVELTTLRVQARHAAAQLQQQAAQIRSLQAGREEETAKLSEIQAELRLVCQSAEAMRLGLRCELDGILGDFKSTMLEVVDGKVQRASSELEARLEASIASERAGRLQLQEQVARLHARQAIQKENASPIAATRITRAMRQRKSFENVDFEQLPYLLETVRIPRMADARSCFGSAQPARKYILVVLSHRRRRRPQMLKRRPQTLRGRPQTLRGRPQTLQRGQTPQAPRLLKQRPSQARCACPGGETRAGG